MCKMIDEMMSTNCLHKIEELIVQQKPLLGFVVPQDHIN